MGVLTTIVFFLRAFLGPRAALAAEILALRHQLGVLQRSVRRPQLRQRDRILWVWLSQLWADWPSCLMIVKPETVIRWHREGFRLYWRWKSRKKKPGRPRIDAEVRQLPPGYEPELLKARKCFQIRKLRYRQELRDSERRRHVVHAVHVERGFSCKLVACQRLQLRSLRGRWEGTGTNRRWLFGGRRAKPAFAWF